MLGAAVGEHKRVEVWLPQHIKWAREQGCTSAVMLADGSVKRFKAANAGAVNQRKQ